MSTRSKITRSFKIDLPDGSIAELEATAFVAKWKESHGERLTELDGIRVSDRDWEELKKAVLSSLEKCDSWFYE